jgi:hypothetical protein
MLGNAGTAEIDFRVHAFDERGTAEQATFHVAAAQRARYRLCGGDDGFKIPPIGVGDRKRIEPLDWHHMLGN